MPVNLKVYLTTRLFVFLMRGLNCFFHALNIFSSPQLIIVF
jgi:hypothetical protein